MKRRKRVRVSSFQKKGKKKENKRWKRSSEREETSAVETRQRRTAWVEEGGATLRDTLRAIYLRIRRWNNAWPRVA